MVNILEREPTDITTRVLFSSIFSVIFFTIFSILVINYITNNFYESSYYTVSALFDAVGIDASSSLGMAVLPFSPPFYAIVLLSVVDGFTKIVIIGFFVATLISVITTLDIGRIALMSRRRWKDHVIVCGYSLLAERVAIDLSDRKLPFIIVDRDEAKVDEINEAGYFSLHEDFTTDRALRSASISTAKTVMFLTKNDYDNLLGVITAKHLNPKAQIIARASDSSTVTKMHRAGAELCVVPEVLAGIDLGESVLARGR